MSKEKKDFILKNIMKQINRVKLFEENNKLSKHMNYIMIKEEGIKEWITDFSLERNLDIDLDNCFVCLSSVDYLFYYELNFKNSETIYSAKIHQRNIFTKNKNYAMSSLVDIHLYNERSLDIVFELYELLSVKEKISNF
jgi:hypothetical protein